MSKGMQQNYVNAGSLFFFSGEVASAFRNDVLTCTLYSQLAASRQHPALHTQYESWANTYISALTRFGCSIPYSFSQSLPVESEGCIWDEVRKGLCKRVVPAMVERAAGVLKDFSVFCEDPVVISTLREYTTQVISPAIYGSDSSPLSNVALQLGFVDAEPVVHLVLLSFNSTQPSSGLPFSQLFTQEKRSGNLQMTVISAEVDEQGFNRFRGEMIERLGPRREQLIKRLSEARP